MKNFLFVLLLFWSPFLYSQLEFCRGSKGDPIFHENFGTGNTSGPPLSAAVTNYTYVTGDPNDGEYTISGRIGQNNTTWHSYFPATTISNGRALIVNADYSSGLFYTTKIEGLCENASYEFSAWLLNVYNRTSNACTNGGIPINVRFEIWDETNTNLLKEGSTGDIASTNNPVWKQYALTFQSGAGQDSVILKMFNNGVGGCGNDLAIDDIIFRSCGDLTEITAEGATGNPYILCESSPPANFRLQANPDFSVYSTHVYQWQESEDGNSWQDIFNEKADNFTTPEINSTRYYRVRVAEAEINLANNLCSSVSEIFQFVYVRTPLAPVSRGNIEICKNEAIPALAVTAQSGETVNWYDAPSGGNLIAENTSSYEVPVAGIYYAEAINTEGCEPGPRTAVSLSFIEVPNIEDEILQLCNNSAINLQAGVPGATYSWSTGESSEEISVIEPGNYSVIITTREGCKVEKKFNIIPVIAAQIAGINSEEGRVIIKTINPGVFEYSLNGRDFQDSNIFENVPGGIYTAFVKDLAGCETAEMRFPHVVVQKYFSPNNDGNNDLFELKGVEYFNSSYIRIYNRYGALIKSGTGEGFSWNGTFNGTQMPAGDYWYDINIEGFKQIKGNFSLLR